MAGRIAYYGNIVTDGLILDLDAAKRDSYPGSGNTWSDISGNRNSGSLVNGPMYSDTNRGILSFDGSNDYISLPTEFFNHNAGTPFSVSMWFKTVNAKGTIFGQQNSPTPGSAGSYVPAIYIDTAGKIRTSCFWGGATANQSVSTLSVNDNVWHSITVTYSNPNHISYLDGVQYATLTKTQTAYSGPYYYYLAVGENSTWASAGSVWFEGSIAGMLFYNKVLSTQEVLQNYNAQKGRFGL